MWKTLGGFSAEISRFQHILPLSTAQINCSGSDLPFFRKPSVGLNSTNIQGFWNTGPSTETEVGQEGTAHAGEGIDGPA
jgi:hypothetical protein